MRRVQSDIYTEDEFTNAHHVRPYERTAVRLHYLRQAFQTNQSFKRSCCRSQQFDALSVRLLRPAVQQTGQLKEAHAPPHEE